MTINQCDIVTWVKAAPDPLQRELREAVHIALWAIGQSPTLQPQMIMKGAILLAIRYQSSRYTRDIDFSTNTLFKKFDEGTFFEELKNKLGLAVEALDYNLDCRIQSYKVKPKKENATFQTLTLSIGYAYKGTPKHSRLMAKICPTVLIIDYSFNEGTDQIDLLDLGQGTIINAYSFTDLVAEKLRAILQQEIRNRVRRQDAYDLYCLFKSHPIDGRDQKEEILRSLIKKSVSRKLEVDRNSMSKTEIINRSKKEYPLLQQEIDEKLPPFEHVYGTVQSFYESLPW